ncbi:MAG: hypothetical protein H0T79_20135 [Deltaproteobacteria bacterium]|nr:hypothetical protein [Deltaproteobacteria bacterium]
MVATWPRDNYVVGGGPGEVALIALSMVRLPDPLPISRRVHGMPEEGLGPDAVALVARDRAEDPAWFAESVLAPFAELIATDLGPSAAAAALAAEHAYVIEAQLDDPEDLGHLQAAWALAKCVCQEGAIVVIDVYAARAHLGVEVAALAPDRAFDIMHEVTLFFDEQDDGSLAAWSLGLRKFGRPDLVLLGVDPEAATDVALILRDVAATLASGERLEPGDQVGAPGGKLLTCEPFDPATAPVVAVEGAALVLRQ